MSAHPPSSSPRLSQRIWFEFQTHRSAYFGLLLILSLFLIAILAPFLANNKPFAMKLHSQWSFPLFNNMSNTDWRYFLYGSGSATIFLLRHHWSWKTGHGLVLCLILIVETFCALRTPVLDGTDYKKIEAVWKCMPLIPYSPYEQTNLEFEPPCLQHPCGTDSLGRDILSRMLYGARTSLSIGFVSQAISITIGTFLGAMSGYFRRWVDISVSRLIEIMECFPTFFLIITVIAFLPKPSLFAIMAVIGLTSWTSVARLVRGEFLKLSVQPFTQAALALGASSTRVMGRHILPNAMGPILVSATFGVASAILVEASLSFLGFGVPPPNPTWGDTLSEARRYIDFAWWLATFPGIAIFITITSYNLVGQGLRDAIDPKARKEPQAAQL